MRATFCAIAGASFLLTACTQPAAPAISSTSSAPTTTPPTGQQPPPHREPAPSQSELFARQVDTFYNWMLTMHPGDAAGRGYHEYDGKLPDVSADGLKTYVEGLQSWKAIFDGAVVSKLTKVQQVEREVLLFEIRGELFDIVDLKLPWKDPMRYMWPVSVAGYITRDYAPLADRAKESSASATARVPTWQTPRPTSPKRCRAPGSIPRCSRPTA